MIRNINVLFFCLSSLVLSAHNGQLLMKQFVNKFQKNKLMYFDMLVDVPSGDIANLGSSSSRVELYANTNQFYLISQDIEILYDGKKQYTINHSDKEVMINEDIKKVLDNPIYFLKDIDSKFTLEDDISKPMSGYSIQFVKCIPKDKKATYKYILLGFHSIKGGIEEVIQVGANDLATRTLVKSIKENPKGVDQHFFKYQPQNYTDYFILDLSR